MLAQHACKGSCLLLQPKAYACAHDGHPETLIALERKAITTKAARLPWSHVAVELSVEA